MKSEGPVLLVTSKFAPHAGGTAMMYKHWCENWPPEQLTVIAPRVPGWQAYDREQPFRVVRVAYPNWPKLRMPILWLLLAWQACWFCWRQRPRFVHFGHVFENAFIGPWIRLWFGCPYGVHLAGEELALARRFWWLKAVVVRVLARADLVTAISRYTASLLPDFGYHRPALLVHPAVDAVRFHPGTPDDWFSRERGITGSPLLLTLGRLMKRKGHDQVLRALPELIPEFPDVQYVIAGVGPHEKALRQLTAELGLEERVHFLGLVAEACLPELLRSAQVFVHPNRVLADGDVEGFGIVFLEAAASGVPVIGGDSGGVPDAVEHGVCGFLVKDQAELVQRLRQLLGDDELCRRMGAAGRVWAEGFRWDSAAQAVWEASF